MNRIIIKPHHFFDIIKLYGTGLERFVPDKNMGHDFYRIGNIILEKPNIVLNLTVDADDICTPCKYCKNNSCQDKLLSIPNYNEKDKYNKNLDYRIIKYFDLELKKDYKAIELCEIYLSDLDLIYKVWIEENNELTEKRYEFFKKGAQKYLKK